MKRPDTEITVSEETVKNEMAKGKHPKTGNWISGLLNHCDPMDDFTAKLIGGEKRPDEKTEDEIGQEVAAIKKEMDDLGIPYDNRWKLARLQAELLKGKKERGL